MLSIVTLLALLPKPSKTRMDQKYVIPKDLIQYIKKTLPAVAHFNIAELTEKYVLSQIKSLDPKKQPVMIKCVYHFYKCVLLQLHRCCAPY